MITELLADMKDRLGKSVQSISRDMAVVRTGKASPALLEHVTLVQESSLVHFHAADTIEGSVDATNTGIAQTVADSESHEPADFR